MTRPEYTVTWEGGQFVKFSWNTARNNIVPTLRNMLQANEVFSRDSLKENATKEAIT